MTRQFFEITQNAIELSPVPIQFCYPARLIYHPARMLCFSGLSCGRDKLRKFADGDFGLVDFFASFYKGQTDHQHSEQADKICHERALICAARYLASSQTPQMNEDPRIDSHGRPRK